MIPGPQRMLRKPSWTGSGPGITGDCLEFAGTTSGFHVAVGTYPVVLADSHLTSPVANQRWTTSFHV
jgi:hypothetical protein